MPLATSAQNASVSAIGALANNGTLQIATDNTFSTILATFTFSPTAFGAPTNGTATASFASSTVTASAGGNAEAWRIRNSSNALVWDRSDTAAVSATGGGGQLVLNQGTTQIVDGQNVSISFSITQPAGV